jgi:hypothetical protein
VFVRPAEKYFRTPLEQVLPNSHFTYIPAIASTTNRSPANPGDPACLRDCKIVIPGRCEAAGKGTQVATAAGEVEQMPIACKAKGSSLPRESWKHWIGITAEDIPQGWMDDMVKRLFEILNRDMIRLERAQIMEPENGPNAKPAAAQLEEVARKERLVAQMQRSLERLTNIEMNRARERKAEGTPSDADIGAELERCIDQLVTGRDAAARRSKSGS